MLCRVCSTLVHPHRLILGVEVGTGSLRQIVAVHACSYHLQIEFQAKVYAFHLFVCVRGGGG